MPRVSESEVQAILPAGMATGSLQPFIVAASLRIDRALVGHGPTADELRELERWYAAHLFAVRSPLLLELGDGDTRARFQRGGVGEGLSTTDYGKQVLALDWTGILAEVTTTKRASIHVD